MTRCANIGQFLTVQFPAVDSALSRDRSWTSGGDICNAFGPAALGSLAETRTLLKDWVWT